VTRIETFKCFGAGASWRKAAVTDLTAGSASSFSTFCHENRENVMEENIIRERLYL